ncbi:MAG: glycosyltransferase family 1 protein [Pedobacter sp.]|nr:MAG: glycosyltransferase family 1 protein [Pedobacter sp.]
MKGDNILFLTLYTFDLTGGIEKVCKNLMDVFKDLRSNGTIEDHQTFSLYDNRQSNPDYQSFGGNKIKFSVNAIRKGLKSNLIILSHINLLIFAKLIRKFNPQKRIVLLAHGIEVWKPLSNWKKKFLSTIEIWAVSNYTAQQLHQINRVPKKQITVLNNCLPKGFAIEEKIKPLSIAKQFQIPADNKILLTTCRLSSSEKYKGYDLVLMALTDLIKIYPNLSYVIVGNGDDEEIERIKKLIHICKLQNHVFFTGYLSDEELKEFYQSADIFIMPSKGEGFGLVYIEAAAYGCMVVAGNAAVIP